MFLSSIATGIGKCFKISNEMFFVTVGYPLEPVRLEKVEKDQRVLVRAV